MQHINLAPHLLPKVLSGQKRATIRRGKKHDVSLGPATIGTNTPIVIIDISYKLFSEIILADVQRDGYANLNDLQQALYGFLPRHSTRRMDNAYKL